jgi:hypothetical protein
MSVENILSITPTKSGCVVIFRVHGGEGTRQYAYYGADAMAVMSGADPADYAGERDGDGGGFSIGGDIGSDIGEAGEAIATDIGEAGLLL